MAELIFWCAAVLLVHTYFFYPLVLFAMDGVAQVAHNLRYMRSGTNQRRAEPVGLAPRVSLVVAVQSPAVPVQSGRPPTVAPAGPSVPPPSTAGAGHGNAVDGSRGGGHPAR